MQKITTWILWSSVNPDKISASLKWAVGFFGSLIVFAGIGHAIPSELVSQFADQLGTVIKQGTELVTSIGFLYTLGRKIVLTFQGKNLGMVR
jgi:hypothetical protein